MSVDYKKCCGSGFINSNPVQNLSLSSDLDPDPDRGFSNTQKFAAEKVILFGIKYYASLFLGLHGDLSSSMYVPLQSSKENLGALNVS